MLHMKYEQKRLITIAHPEHSLGELKYNKQSQGMKDHDTCRKAQTTVMKNLMLWIKSQLSYPLGYGHPQLVARGNTQ